MYVQDVFTTAGENGASAAANGNALAATVLNLIIPSKYQDTLNLAKEDGTLYIAKVLSKRETSSYIDPVIEFDETMGEVPDLEFNTKEENALVTNIDTYTVVDAEGNEHTLQVTTTDGVVTYMYDGEDAE